jgi:hypothetical protein
MNVAAMVISAIVFVLLLAIALAQLMWAIGASWPIRDRALLAKTVVGRPNVDAVPRLPALLLAVLALGAGIAALSLADPAGGGAMLTLLGALLAGLFLARGVLGYTPNWRALHPVEPYATLDRKNYSPLALAIGVGFAILVLMRLI